MRVSHCNIGGLVDHLAGLGVDLLAGLQAHSRHLQVVALNGVVQAVGTGAAGAPATATPACACPQAGQKREPSAI